jgi:hypothetical protein
LGDFITFFLKCGEFFEKFPTSSLDHVAPRFKKKTMEKIHHKVG